MAEFGKLKRISLREVWKNEARNFTPWLQENIEVLGEVLGMDLEVVEREAEVGSFSLDLLAEDLGTKRSVIIENQLTQTDHDHLGKLLTYAAGYEAESVIWIADSIRDEHRQALEWLNQRTDTRTSFFAVVVEVLQIDDSRPAYKFQPVVYPNEWQKGTRQSTSTAPSPKGAAYQDFFQNVIDELRTKYKFTSARKGQPQNWYTFSSGFSDFGYAVNFTREGRIKIALEIYSNSQEKNHDLFRKMRQYQSEIESSLGFPLEWNLLEHIRPSRIEFFKKGSIEDSPEELAQTHRWVVENLTKFKKVLTPFIKKSLNAKAPTKPVPELV